MTCKSTTTSLRGVTQSHVPVTSLQEGPKYASLSNNIKTLKMVEFQAILLKFQIFGTHLMTCKSTTTSLRGVTQSHVPVTIVQEGPKYASLSKKT